MTNEQYMEIAIRIAKKSDEKIKVGVVIVKDQQIISQTYNSHHQDHDATAHAEIKAIREAGNILGTKNLHGCIVFTTCEPCTMCASALFYAEVKKMYYASTMAFIDPYNTRIKISIEELSSKIAKPPIIIKFMEQEVISRLYGNLI